MSLPYRILVVEDEPDHIFFLEMALEQANGSLLVDIATDGQMALDYLKTTRPDVIFLDINLGRLSGFDVLKTIKADSTKKTIPVVMMTTSRAQQNIIDAWNLNCNGYLKKPDEFSKLLEIVRRVLEFYKVQELPNRVDR